MRKMSPPAVEEVAMIVERAKQAAATTRQLAREYRFIVAWYSMRPRSRVRPFLILDGSDRAAKADPERALGFS